MRGNDSLPPLNAGILIGGSSTRMGRPKHLIEWEGRTFLARIVEAVSPHVERIALLGAGDVPAEFATLERIADAPGVSGPLAGILAALHAHPDRAWLIVACDMPRITQATVEWLAAQRRPGWIAITPRSSTAHVEPLLAIYEPPARERLEAAAARGCEAPREIAFDDGVICPDIPTRLARDFSNVNTGADAADASMKPRSLGS